MTIGLIGYGRFGKFLAPYLAEKATLLVFDVNRRYGRFPSPNIRSAALATVATQPIVILAVPVCRMQQALQAIAPHLRPGTLVVDVCSVKTVPVRWMRTLLPRSVHLLGTHPLLGPDSASRTLKGHTVVLCPVRIPAQLLATVRSTLRSYGLAARIMTAQQHDKFIAKTLLVTQFVGRTIARSGLRQTRHATPSYHALMNIVRIADNDSRELFHDMIRFNPFAVGILRKIHRAQKALLATVPMTLDS